MDKYIAELNEQSELRKEVCAIAMQGIDDPEAFMRDFKDLVENIESAYVDGLFVKGELQDMKDEYLKPTTTQEGE